MKRTKCYLPDRPIEAIEGTRYFFDALAYHAGKAIQNASSPTTVEQVFHATATSYSEGPAKKRRLNHCDFPV